MPPILSAVACPGVVRTGVAGRGLLALCLLVLAGFPCGEVANAAIIGVGTSADPPSGTRCALRDAIAAANTDAPSGFCTAGDGADTIVFARSVDTVSLQAELVVTGADALVIDGRGYRVVIERDPAAPEFSVLRATNADNVLTLRNVHVRGGVQASDTIGGGIGSAGNVVLEDSVVSGNVVNGANGDGGGIRADGEVRLLRSEVSGNLVNGSQGMGGGIYAEWVYLEDSSVLDNQVTAGVAGGGIAVQQGIEATRSLIAGNAVAGTFSHGGGLYGVGVALVNSTVSGNRAGRGGGLVGTLINLTSSTVTDNIAADNVTGGIELVGSEQIPGQLGALGSIVHGNLGNIGSFTSGGTVSGQSNLIGPVATSLELPPDTLDCDPLLHPLADNGGPTWTHALSPDSCAIDAGSNAQSLATDQRGNARVVGAAADIGAFELGADSIFADGFEP